MGERKERGEKNRPLGKLSVAGSGLVLNKSLDKKLRRCNNVTLLKIVRSIYYILLKKKKKSQ